MILRNCDSTSYKRNLGRILYFKIVGTHKQIFNVEVRIESSGSMPSGKAPSKVPLVNEDSASDGSDEDEIEEEMTTKSQTHLADHWRQGRFPRPILICCGSIGFVLIVLGGIVVGVGKMRLKRTDDYTFILTGSVFLGVGILVSILALLTSLALRAAINYEYKLPKHHSDKAQRAEIMGKEEIEETHDFELASTSKA